MTGNVLIDLIISIAGIMLLVVMARFMFPSPRFRVVRNEAITYLTLEEPDYEFARELMDDQCRVLLLVSADWQDYVVICEGMSDFIHRRFSMKSILDVEIIENGFCLKLDDPIFKFPAFRGHEAENFAVKLSASWNQNRVMLKR